MQCTLSLGKRAWCPAFASMQNYSTFQEFCILPYIFYIIISGMYYIMSIGWSHFIVFIVVNSGVVNGCHSESEDILMKPSPFPSLNEEQL